MEVNYGIRFTTNDELEAFLKQLCTEVHIRLMEIKRRGKSITLKYMIRSKDAPLETAKFMGHGVCDNLTKSHSLQDFTCSLDVIVKTVLQIKNALNVPPDQLRGIGIHIGRLDTVDENNRNSTNILKSMFDKVAVRNLQKPTEKRNESVLAKSAKQSPNKSLVPVERSLKSRRGASSKMVSTRGRGRGGRARQTPSSRSVSTMLTNMTGKTADPTSGNASSVDFGEIDMTTLMELPVNIREEIMSDYKSRAKSMAKNAKKQPKLIKCDNDDAIDPDFLAALPLDIRNELMSKNGNKSIVKMLPVAEEQKIITVKSPTPSPAGTPEKVSFTELVQPESGGISAENVFVDSNWRTILYAWTESTDDPMPGDIDTLALYGNELIFMNRLNELYIGLRYMHR